MGYLPKCIMSTSDRAKMSLNLKLCYTLPPSLLSLKMSVFLHERNTKTFEIIHQQIQLKLKLHNLLVCFPCPFCKLNDFEPKLENMEFKLVCLAKTRYLFAHWNTNKLGWGVRG